MPDFSVVNHQTPPTPRLHFGREGSVLWKQIGRTTTLVDSVINLVSPSGDDGEWLPLITNYTGCAPAGRDMFDAVVLCTAFKPHNPLGGLPLVGASLQGLHRFLRLVVNPPLLPFVVGYGVFTTDSGRRRRYWRLCRPQERVRYTDLDTTMKYDAQLEAIAIPGAPGSNWCSCRPITSLNRSHFG